MLSHTLFEKLDEKFRETCKILFGDEIGSLADFAQYLEEHIQKPQRFYSHNLGKIGSVYVSGEHYVASAKFVNFDEIDWKKKFSALSINEIKDIDSIVEALGERFIYSGNIILGRSSNVESSANVLNSFFVLNSNLISQSEYVAYSSFARKCKYIFGSHDVAQANFAIRTLCSGGPLGGNRIFEGFLITASSDIFYSSNLHGCQKCWFSFFQRGKKHVIGNLQLSLEEYMKIESHLREQVREELSSKKRIIGLFDILKNKEKDDLITGEAVSDGCDPKKAKEETENAWRSTSRIVLGKELQDMDKYSDWLSKNVDFYDIATEQSPITGANVYIAKKYWKLENLTEVFVGMEKEQLNLLHLDKAVLSKSFLEIAKSAKRIAFISLYCSEKCINLDVPIVCINAINSYKTIMSVLSKNVAFSFWPRESTNIFGSSVVFSSAFCINAHYVQDVTRTFEVDMAVNSSDIYFCHNVEGLSDGMFCFNAKSMRNAIGNVEYSKDDYAKLKGNLLRQISEELEKTKKLKWNIYNLY
ncbi:MAG: hypothetical protein AB1391_04820 [Candidatus Micrarchaeota archaeon]